ncbi:MAG: hypothetical protein KDC98_00710 [Planctomycetes bacterium]|nr:hypothetical protein [Planctomycetota bacterium]
MFVSRLIGPLAVAAVVGLAGCSSKVESTLDPDAQAKAAVIANCIPPQIEKLDELLAFSELWRLNDSDTNPPDPSELTWSYASGEIGYTVALSSYSISGIIRFYSPTGGQQTSLTLSSVSLSQAIDDAATQLASMFPGELPFMVGEWMISGANVSSAGVTSSPASFTGMIRGSSNGNELEELRLTEGTAAVSSGTPPVQNCTITTTGSETCVFTFGMPTLATDTEPNQQYPIGTITFTLVNQTAGLTLTGSLTMNNTVTARLDVDSLPGYFEINLETYSVTHKL